MPVPKLLVTGALMLAQVAIGAARKIEGPRLDDLNVSLADYGTPIPRIWGTRRIQPQTIWAEKLREKKKKSKTKGGKYTEYKYYGTWAVLLCDHEIDAVTRIWMDKRLVYQRTSAGPISPAVALVLANIQGQSIKLSAGGNMRIYLGTETQTQDPRIEAWCEDRYGPDSCPAYRGSAYIVFQEIPLETVGNRIPQISVEVVNNPSNAYPYDTKTTSLTVAATNTYFAFGGPWLAQQTDPARAIEWWDVPTRARLGTSTAPGLATGSASENSLATDGTAYCVGRQFGGSDKYLAVTSPLGTPELTLTDAAAAFFGKTRVLESGSIRKIYTTYSDNVGYLDYSTHVNHGQAARDFCVDGDGHFWGIFHPEGSSDQFTIQNLLTGTGYTFTGLVTRSDVGAAQICHVAQHGHFFVSSDAKFYIIDDTTFAVTSSGAFTDTARLSAQNPNATSAWDVDTSTFYEYSLQDGSLIRSVARSNFLTFVDVGQEYDPVNHAVWAGKASTDTIYVMYVDRVSSNGVTLQTIVDDVSGWVGLTGQDTAALTQTVYGYSITQGPAKDMIQPLLDIHDVDARPHDFTVQFKVRGSSPSGSIATSEFVPNPDRYKVAIRQDTDLPRRVTINFADRDKDQQTNTAITQRPLDAVDSNREETIDLTTYVDTPDEAQQKADRYFRRQWNSRERISLSLTPQELALEPGDVTTISLDGANRNVRLDKLTISQSQLNCELVRDETSFAAVNSATTGAGMDGRDDEGIFIPGPSKGFIIDGNLVEDVDNESNPIIYYAAGPYAGSFSGALLAEGDGLDYDNIIGGIDSSSDAKWGFATTALATANPNVWDRGNTVTINVLNGPLTSVTEAQINTDPALNLAAIGTDGRWEYIQFATATLNGDGTYTLSILKRGRRGTEINTANHAIGDEFVLLEQREHMERGTADIGDALTFKIETVGRDIDSAQAIDITYDAACLKPYAPCSFKANHDAATNDWGFSWIRRTRLGGSWNGATIPLSEDSEDYDFVVMNGASEVRVINGSSASCLYTSAQQVTDWGSNQSTLTVKVFQRSATVGRGYAASATFTA